MTAASSVALALALITGPEFGWNTYPASSLRDLEKRELAEHPDLVKPRGEHDFFNIHPVVKARVRVVATGKSRPLSGAKQQLVEDWCKYYFPQQANGGFRREVLVSEDGRERWLTLQEGLWPYFQREVQAGKPVYFFVAFIGTANDEWVYLANEFLVELPPELSSGPAAPPAR